MSDLFCLKGNVAVVIGGTGSLGGAMADALANAGATTIVCGRNEENGRRRVQEIMDAGGTADFAVADALSVDSLKACCDGICDKHGVPSILINAAGGNHPAATLSPGDQFENLPIDAWSRVFDLNLVGGSLLPSQIFGAPMVAAGQGSIINIASMSGMIPLSRVVAYSAAKAAVLNLTMFLAREWAKKGVRVNAISPGFFPAEQNKALLYNEDGSYSERGG
ncbi:MAG: SDR family NAD(P)-dependent oxidoreductase, partial [Planctomycetota bacterium]